MRPGEPWQESDGGAVLLVDCDRAHGYRCWHTSTSSGLICIMRWCLLAGAMPAHMNEVRTALLALSLSGAASLGHQLLWTRRMTDLLGAGADASARVIGCYFLGLALGAAYTARILPSLKSLWKWAALAECSAAILAVPIMFLPSISDPLWLLLGPADLGTWRIAAIRLVLSLIAVVPPAFALGMSLPLIVGAVGPKRESIYSHPIWLYMTYTAGCATGLALVVGVTLRTFGSLGSMLAMMLLNLGAALLCWRQSRLIPEPSIQQAINSPQQVKPACQSGYIYIMAFVSGGGVIATELLSIELINLVAPLAFYPQATALFSAITSLALGAWLCALIVPRIRSGISTIPWVLSCASVLVACIPLIFIYLIASRITLGYSDSLLGFIVQMLASGLVTLGVPLLIAGAVFPILISLPTSSSPSTVAKLLAVNGIGGLIGSEIALRYLLPVGGVHIALGLLGCLYSVAALISLGVSQRKGFVRILPPLLALSGCVLITGGPLTDLRVFEEAPSFRVIDISSTRDGSLAVVERDGMGRGMIFNNQYLLGASAGSSDMRRQTHIPLLLHANPKQVAFLGLGTGITASAALQHEVVEFITAVEISPLVARASARFFSDLNYGFATNSRVRVLVEDARTFTVASRDTFDVIIGDLFTPWRPGEARLCAREQFAAARRALRGHGVFCQWLPMHQLTLEQFELIASTFRSVFPRTYVFRNHFRNRSLPVALVGFLDGDLDWTTVANRADALVSQNRVHDPLCRHVEGIAMLCLGTLDARDSVQPLNGLGNMRLELAAGYNLILKGYTNFLTGTSQGWEELAGRQVADITNSQALPEPLRGLPAFGMLVEKFDEIAQQGHPATESYRRNILAGFPTSMLQDKGADWALWAGDVSPFQTNGPAKRR